MSRVYLSIGSNVLNRRLYLQQALYKIQDFAQILKISSIYETEPVGMTAKQWFYNLAVEIKTNLLPLNLLMNLKAIEQELGRKPGTHNKSREVDIDILFYENFVYIDNQLRVPHAKLHNRRFVLEPLKEIAPDYVHPILQKSVASMLRECRDTSKVRVKNVHINIPVICEDIV